MASTLMEAILVKREEKPVRGRLNMDDGEAHEARYVKRRRRDSATIALSRNIAEQQQPQQVAEQASTPTTVKRSSRFRGVSKHKWTGRFEAHLWDKLSWNATQKKKGKQVYLGAYDEEESAARAYDLAALKYWGASTFTNFPVSDYEGELRNMQCVTKEEYLASLRRKSSGFSRGVSKFRGVARHHHNGRWEARIGRVFGNKYLYLGTYSTQEEAARAYDIAAIEYRGINAVTNFELSTYIRWLNPGATAAQKPETNTELLTVTFDNFSSDKECAYLSKAISSDDLKSQLKQENIFQSNFSMGTYNKASSPTALGLLLRSSVFKDLVEKNSVISTESDVADDITSQPHMSSDDEYAEIQNGVNEGIPCVLGIGLQGHFNLNHNIYSSLLGTPL